MDRRNIRETEIVAVQCLSHVGKAGHEPLQRQPAAIGAAEQALDLTLVSHDKASVPSFDQRRAAKHQALLGAGEAEIVFAIFTETPRLMDHAGSPLRRLYNRFEDLCQYKSDNCRIFRYETRYPDIPLRGRMGLIATPKAYIQAA
jgi:hypothetical protein